SCAPSDVARGLPRRQPAAWPCAPAMERTRLRVTELRVRPLRTGPVRGDARRSRTVLRLRFLRLARRLGARLRTEPGGHSMKYAPHAIAVGILVAAAATSWSPMARAQDGTDPDLWNFPEATEPET